MFNLLCFCVCLILAAGWATNDLQHMCLCLLSVSTTSYHPHWPRTRELSIHPPGHLYISLYIHPPGRLYIHPLGHLYIHPPGPLYIHLYIHPPGHPSIHPSIHLSLSANCGFDFVFYQNNVYKGIKEVMQFNSTLSNSITWFHPHPGTSLMWAESHDRHERSHIRTSLINVSFLPSSLFLPVFTNRDRNHKFFISQNPESSQSTKPKWYKAFTKKT